MPKPTLSQRGDTAPASPIRRLAPYAQAARDRGITVHHLNIGQPDLPTPKQMIDAYRNYDELVLAYAPSDGFLAYRQKLADHYTELARANGGADLGPEDIVVTVGGSEALLFTMAAIADPGDELLIPEPFYTNYSGFAHMLGLRVRPVTTQSCDGFRIDPERVRAAITERTVGLVVCSPGNPTGVVLARPEIDALADLCRQRGLFYISDEVYREFVYDRPEGSRAPSLLGLRDFDEHGVVIDSVSKRYSACGARVGALITRNSALRSSALRFGQARLSPATVDQYAAMAALATPPEYFSDVVREYTTRRNTLVRALRDIGVHCTTPEGAFYLVTKVPVADADDFCEFLLRDFSLDGETVMLAPASGFYATEGLGKDEVRIAYVLEAPKLERCARILGEAFKAYAKRTP
jgi:aspartate aminotransferase